MHLAAATPVHHNFKPADLQHFQIGADTGF